LYSSLKKFNAISPKIVQKFVRIIGHEKRTLSKKAVRPAHLLDMQQMSFFKHSTL